MNHASTSNQEVIDNIAKKVSSLRNDELHYISHALDALIESRDSSMHYLGKFLGITESDEGFVMDLGKQNENIYGVAQGGAVYTLADVSIGFNILQQLSGTGKVLTQELKVNFIKKGEGDFLYASPNVLHKGRKTVIADCSIRDRNGQLVAQALGTFYITER